MPEIGKVLEFLPKIFRSISDTKIHYVLLSFSFILVALSISFNRFFFESFLTFIYAVVFAHIQLARKQEFVESFGVKQTTLLQHSQYFVYCYDCSLDS